MAAPIRHSSLHFTLTGANVVYALPANVNQFSGYPANPNARQTFDPNTNLPITAHHN